MHPLSSRGRWAVPTSSGLHLDWTRLRAYLALKANAGPRAAGAHGRTASLACKPMSGRRLRIDQRVLARPDPCLNDKRTQQLQWSLSQRTVGFPRRSFERSSTVTDLSRCICRKSCRLFGAASQIRFLTFRRGMTVEIERLGRRPPAFFEGPARPSAGRRGGPTVSPGIPGSPIFRFFASRPSSPTEEDHRMRPSELGRGLPGRVDGGGSMGYGPRSQRSGRLDRGVRRNGRLGICRPSPVGVQGGTRWP
jgi:hypothetical protein